MPHFSPQQRKVYDYVKTHEGYTIREIRDETRVMKPDMRISELNFQHREKTGEDLIVNCGKTRSGEVKKMIKHKETRYEYIYDEIKGVMVESIRET